MANVNYIGSSDTDSILENFTEVSIPLRTLGYSVTFSVKIQRFLLFFQIFRAVAANLVFTSAAIVDNACYFGLKLYVSEHILKDYQ